MKNAAKSAGFTLLELLVAAVIFSAVLSAVYGLLGAARSVSSRAETRAQVLQTARAALRAIESDLRGAFASGSAFDTGFIGINGQSEGLPADTLELVAVNYWPERTPDIGALPERKTDVSRILYRVEDGRSSATSKRGLVRERLPLLAPSTVYSSSQEENIEELAPDVVGLDFRYFRDNWEESWDSTVSRKLPKVVEVAVHVRSEWRGEEQVERFVTRFYLPLGAEAPERPQ